MDKEVYAEIIKKYIFPFAGNMYNYQIELHQDNDSKHTSSVCKNLLQELNINWIQSPPYSPDFNPIEMVWADLKRHVRKSLCTSIDDVMAHVSDFQKLLTPAKCKAYIEHLHGVIATVIQKNGSWSCGV